MYYFPFRWPRTCLSSCGPDCIQMQNDAQRLLFRRLQGERPVQEKNRSLVSLLQPVFRLGDRFQGEAPELPLGGQIQGEFESRRFVAQPDVFNLRYSPGGTKPSILDLEAGEEEVPLRVFPRQEGEVQFYSEPE